MSEKGRLLPGAARKLERRLQNRKETLWNQISRRGSAKNGDLAAR